jgi:hypothetical protein
MEEREKNTIWLFAKVKTVLRYLPAAATEEELSSGNTSLFSAAK